MTDQTLSVALFLFIPPEDFIPEADVAGIDPSRLDASFEQEGSLHISQGETLIDITDALQWMVPGLCFDGLVALRETGTFTLDLFTSDERISLRRDGAVVELKGEYIDPEIFPADAFEAAMLGAGERYLALAAQAWPSRTDAEVENLNARAQKAKEALAVG